MKKYSIIYADPPWAYRTYSKKGQGRSAESHYPTMCIEDIKALPVGELAAKDCALFLWITFPCLCEALEVLTAWGFSYKTVAFVWVKQNRKNDDLFTGMGYWTRANAEICILATILTRDTSRISRDTSSFMRFERKFRENGIRFEYLSKPDNELPVTPMLEAFAAAYKKRRTKNGTRA